MKFKSDVVEAVGNTPLVRLNRLAGEGIEVLAKLEYFNPGGSVKDRIARAMIEAAEREGRLRPGMTIVEPTSGNTGIGLAMVGAARGYEVILAMPETMSIERRTLLKSYGAKLLLTPGKEGMKGAIIRAEKLVADNDKCIMLDQFNNPANPQAHRETTAREILAQTEGELDAFVAGVGTGGTITGVGEVLKREIPAVKIYAVEPERSPVLSGGESGSHGIQGIGAGFIPSILNQDIIDGIVTVSDEDAYQTARELAQEEGLFVGISAGAAVYAALEVAKKTGITRIVTVLPDTGERYLSLWQGRDK